MIPSPLVGEAGRRPDEGKAFPEASGRAHPSSAPSGHLLPQGKKGECVLVIDGFRQNSLTGEGMSIRSRSRWVPEKTSPSDPARHGVGWIVRRMRCRSLAPGKGAGRDAVSVRWRSGRRRDRCVTCWRRWRSAPPAGRRDGPLGPRSRRGGPGRRPRPTRSPPDSRSPSYTCLRSSKTKLPIGGTRRPEPAGRRSTTPFGPPGIPIPRGVAMRGGPTGSVSSTARIGRGPVRRDESAARRCNRDRRDDPDSNVPIRRSRTLTRSDDYRRHFSR